ncbi:uncharacterized protein LOC131948737 [Physella acuta]|uniref:uncharacterized protein LOC131948737 n=1 Tax=Physella acuta TaxID=109671 RepID=UPI0027DDB1A0|nr:uncharacterized protein LOC131948737 [Physella acuta]
MSVSRKWDPWKMYDATPDELRAIKERAKARENRKAEWMKKHSNPFRAAGGSGFLLDPAVQRFIALKATQNERFKYTFSSFGIACLLFVFPVSLLTYTAYQNHVEKERKYRNGEVMYKDRKDKFF